MEVKATAKYMRISAQKVRKIVDGIKGKPAEMGLNALKFMPQKSAGIVHKILRSAIANADQNAELDVDSLVIKNIIFDEGPKVKRFRARARGRGCIILKRTDNIKTIHAEGKG